MTTFLLPDLGEGLTEASVVRWLVAEGDTVTLDQPVAEVETAKAVVEVPTPFAGVVTALHVAVGGTASVGEALLSVEPAHAPAGSGAVLVGYGTGVAAGPRRHRRPRRAVTAAEVAPSARPAPPAARATPGGATGAHRPRVVSPLVRRLAQEWGVDVRTVRGTGHAGLILRRDVERAAAAALPTPAAPPPAPAPAPAPAGEERVALSGIGAAAAAVYERSRREIPDVTIWVDVDATPLVSLRESAPDGPGLLAYLARFTVAALRAYPVFNSRFDADRREIVHHPHVHLGVAVQGARGLVVPVVHDADTLTTAALHTAIRGVTAAAREGTPTRDGGTFTLNNYGAFAVDGGTPILIPPQVGMLGVGRIAERPWVVDGRIAVRTIVQLTFVFDHRVCDGAVASGFLRRIADAVENPAAAVAHL